MNDIALVIACHKSKDNIIKTLHAAHHYAHFPLDNVSIAILTLLISHLLSVYYYSFTCFKIYVAHNAGTPEPIDETGPTVWYVHFHYYFVYLFIYLHNM